MWHTRDQVTHSKMVAQQCNINGGSKIHDIRCKKILPQYTTDAIGLYPYETKQFSRMFHQRTRLNKNVMKYGWVYARIIRVMYGFLQVGLLSQQFLEERFIKTRIFTK